MMSNPFEKATYQKVVDQQSDTASNRFADLQQARCPIHNVPLDGWGLCRTNTSIGCDWNRKQAMGILNSTPSVYSQADLQNAAVFWSADHEVAFYKNEYLRVHGRWQATQGIRGALRNLWRQMWR